MQPERWQKVKELFHGAALLPENERAEFLDSQCGGNPELRAEVVSLLQSSEQAGEFLEPGATGLSGTTESVSAADPWIGKRAGPYEILERLGSGGMGVVYRAEDRHLGRSAAIKVLSSDLQLDEQARKRFAREARAASALNHPNICIIYGADEVEGHPYLAMELLKGQTLNEIIHGKSLDVRRIVEIAIPITEALEAAHAERIIHRDIKPSNIFLTERGQVKVLDFGLAKQLRLLAKTDPSRPNNPPSEKDVLTARGTAVGTVAYMSPEQVRAESLDGRSDLFSFGTVLYEMATGSKAFPGRTPITTLDAILNEAPAPAATLNPQVNARLVKIIDRALQKNRESRYQTVTELRADLEALRLELIGGMPASGVALQPERTWPSLWRALSSAFAWLKRLLAKFPAFFRPAKKPLS